MTKQNKVIGRYIYITNKNKLKLQIHIHTTLQGYILDKFLPHIKCTHKTYTRLTKAGHYSSEKRNGSGL